VKLRVLVPYSEEITYRQMQEILEETAMKIGWAVSKSGYRPVDFQTEIVVDESVTRTTRLAISARVHRPFNNGRYGVDPHGD
jgi:hypothetical protein